MATSFKGEHILVGNQQYPGSRSHGAHSQRLSIPPATGQANNKPVRVESHTTQITKTRTLDDMEKMCVEEHQ